MMDLGKVNEAWRPGYDDDTAGNLAGHGVKRIDESADKRSARKLALVVPAVALSLGIFALWSKRRDQNRTTQTMEEKQRNA